MIYTNKEKDEPIVICDCGCGSGLHWKASQWDDEDKQYFVSLIESSWDARQTGRAKPYFKRLWKAIRGKEYYLTELVLTKEDVVEFDEALRCLLKYPMN